MDLLRVAKVAIGHEPVVGFGERDYAARQVHGEGDHVAAFVGEGAHRDGPSVIGQREPAQTLRRGW